MARTIRWKRGNTVMQKEIVMKLIGDIQISRIDEDVVAELVSKLEARGNKPGTVKQILAALKTTTPAQQEPWDPY